MKFVIIINVDVIINENFIIQIKSLLKIIEFIILILFNYNQNIVFRSYQHIKINARLISNFNNIKICLNFDYLIIFNDRAMFIILLDFENRILK